MRCLLAPNRFLKKSLILVTFKVDKSNFAQYQENKSFKPGRVIFMAFTDKLDTGIISFTTIKLCFTDFEIDKIGHTRTKTVFCEQYPSLL